MEFVVQFKDKTESWDFESSSLPQLLSQLWHGGLKNVQAMSTQKMEAELEKIYSAHKGESSFIHRGKVNGVPMGLKFEGTWEQGEFEPATVTLYNSYYNPKRSFSVDGEKQNRNNQTASSVLNAFEEPKDKPKKGSRYWRARLTDVIEKAEDDSLVVENNGEPLELKEPLVGKKEDLSIEQSPQPAPSRLRRGIGKVVSVTTTALPHVLTAGGVYLGLDYLGTEALGALGQGAAELLASTGLAQLTLPIAAAGATLLTTGTSHLSRHAYKQSQLNSYKAKTDEQLDALSPNQVEAFKDGVNSSKSLVSNAGAFVSWRDYRHANAYTAGLTAGQQGEQELVERVSSKLKV